MKKRIFNSVGSVFILICVAVFGTMMTSWNIMQIYAASHLVWWAALLCAFGGALICVGIKLMGRAGIIPEIILLAGLIAFSTVRYDIVIGGFAYIFNFLIESLNNYYNSEIYYVLLTEKMLLNGSQPLFMMIVCILSGWWYMSVLLKRRGILLAALFSILSYMLPATLEDTSSVIFLVGMLSFVVCVIVHGALPNEKNELRARMSGILAMFWVFLLSLLVVFAATKIVPEKNFSAPGLYDKLMGKVVFSIKDIQDVAAGYGKNKGNNSPVTGSGAIGRLDTVEYDDVPLISVKAPKNGGTIYLKTFQAANYTKRRWRELEASVYSRYSEMFDEMQNAGNSPMLMEYRAVSQLTGMGAVGIASADYDIDVMQYECDGNSYIPMSAIQIDGIFVDEIAKDDKNITLDTDTAGAQSVSHSYRLYEWRNFSTLDKLVIDGEALAYNEDNAYRSFVYENYLDVDESCDDRIKAQLFPSIKSSDYSIDDVSSRARFIMDTVSFFAKEYEYTLSPGTTPGSKDYVEYFLFEKKKGLCSHFASAAVMIFRSAGIPARYVEGFVVPESLYTGEPVSSKEVVIRGNGEFRKEQWEYYDIVLTDRYAHAWVEVYIDGIGWVTVDPTPGYASGYVKNQAWYNESDIADNDADENNAESEQEATSDMALDDTEDTMADESTSQSEDGTDVNSETILPGVIEPDSDDASAGGNVTDTGSKPVDISALFSKLSAAVKPMFILLFTILKIIAVPLIIVLFFITRQKYMERRRTKLYNSSCGLDTGERVRQIMLYFERMLQHTDVKVDESMDIAQLINSLTVDGIDSSAVADAAMRALFSDKIISEDDAMIIMAYVAAARNSIYKSKNIFGRLFFKYILAL